MIQPLENIHQKRKKNLHVPFDSAILLQEIYLTAISSVSSVAQSCLTLCDPMNHSTPGLPVHHHLPEFTQTHVHRVDDAIQPSHPLSSPFPPAPIPPSIRVFSNESTLCMRWPKYWSFSFSIWIDAIGKDIYTKILFLQHSVQLKCLLIKCGWIRYGS